MLKYSYSKIKVSGHAMAFQKYKSMEKMQRKHLSISNSKYMLLDITTL